MLGLGMLEVSLMTAAIIRFAKPEEASLLSELALRSKSYWGYAADFLVSCTAELTYKKSQLSSAATCFKVAETESCSIPGRFLPLLEICL
jgi:hypothetical protein